MRTIIGLATITLALALTGCQKQSTDDADEPDEPSGEATKDEPATDEKPADTAAASDTAAAADPPANTVAGKPPAPATGQPIPGVSPTAGGTSTAGIAAPPDKTAPPTTTTRPKEPQRCGARFPPCPAGMKCTSERIGICQ